MSKDNGVGHIPLRTEDSCPGSPGSLQVCAFFSPDARSPSALFASLPLTCTSLLYKTLEMALAQPAEKKRIEETTAEDVRREKGVRENGGLHTLNAAYVKGSSRNRRKIKNEKSCIARSLRCRSYGNSTRVHCTSEPPAATMARLTALLLLVVSGHHALGFTARGFLPRPQSTRVVSG